MTQLKGEMHFNGCIMTKLPNFKLKYGKNGQFIRGNWLLFKIIQEKNLKLKGEKLKTQAKNSRFRQNQKRGLPKIGRKKKAGLSKQTSVEIIFCAET